MFTFARLGAGTLVLATALSGAIAPGYASPSASPSADPSSGPSAGPSSRSSASPSSTPTPTTIPSRTSSSAAAPAVAARARRTQVFRIATFNVLGASHTPKSGPHSGVRRMRGAVHLLNSRHISIAGMQEFEKIQYQRFLQLTHHKWGVVSVPRGKGIDTRDAIVYRKSRFKLLRKTWVTIPYYGPSVRIPVARMKARKSGTVFYIMNTHNAADVHGNAEHKRRVSVRRQVKKLIELRHRGAPVFFTGDMNERGKVHCAVTYRGHFKAASGGSVGKHCSRPLANGIDWIFGSRDVKFAHWESDKTSQKWGTSDHALVYTSVRIHR